MLKISGDLAFRGLVHQASDDALWTLLDSGSTTAYIGMDPTSDSLHVGNLLGIITLRRLQEAGHRPILLAGGGTGLIGDPGGKADERPLLSVEQLAANLEGIRAQLEGLLDLSPAAGEAQGLLVDNSEWLCSYGFIDFLRDIGKHFTVNQMIGKESVRTRLERPDQGISYTEFSYMLLQAYDYLYLHDAYGCRVQLGGSDQWGNITMGVDLVRKVERAEVFGLTTPLVTKADGTKFGKSESGADRVWLDPTMTSPYRLYQFLFNSEDAIVGDYLRYFTFLVREEIEGLDLETEAHPERRSAQRALARAVCGLVHGTEEVERAERAAAALFGEEIAELDEATLLEVVDDAPSTKVPRTALLGGADGGLPLVDAVVMSGLANSKSRARQSIDGGGVYVNNRRVDDPTATLGVADLLHDRYVVLRLGKRNYHLLVAG